jgi:DNA end-binding protein Ku
MPRSIWTGSISFGLVNVPIKLYPATQSKDVHFHQLQENTGRRVRQKRVAEGTGREVAYEDVVKGYEVSKGRYVTVSDEELESVEPTQTKTIDIEDFVSLEEIDPIYFEKAYYLEPAKGGEKAYALLREAMAKSERIAIARFVMRTKQYLAAIRPRDKVLLLETMFFADEIREPGDLKLPGNLKLSDREVRIAKQLIDSLTVDFKPGSYKDTYRDAVLGLIKKKAKGDEIVVERDAEKAPQVTDLMAALEASMSDVRGARSGRKPAARKRAQRRPQKRAARRPQKKAQKKAS